MMRVQGFALLAAVALLMFAAACGTVSEPRYTSDATASAEAVIAQQNAEQDEADVQVVAEQPSSTPTLEPTNTPPPTNTPTPQPPTATPLPPTATLTPEPTQIGAGDPLFPEIASADVENGAALFQMIEGGAACATCHYIDSEEMLVGPGQWNLIYRAGDRVEGQGPYTYMYNSVVNPAAHIVEGYPNAMPMNYSDLLTEQEIYDIVAYMATLRDEQ